MNDETKNKVVDLIVEKTGVAREHFFATGRVRKYAHARFLAAYVMRTLFIVPTTELGLFFNRDHSVIIYYCCQAKKLIETYPEKHAEYDHIKEVVSGWHNTEPDANAELFALYAKQKHQIRSLKEENAKFKDRIEILESLLTIEQKIKIA